MRRLLNEKVKPAAVDLCQFGGSLRDGIRGARTVINQRHLAKERALPGGFEHKITEEDVDFAFQQNLHLLAFLAFPEQEIARRKLHRVTFLPKQLCRIHGPDFNCSQL